MTLQQLYDLIVQVGLHFQAIATDIDLLRAWLRIGYPVIIAGAESGMYDIGLGDVVPYPWRPSGNHIIVISGVTLNGNFLVRDSANCTDLSNPNSLRPGPRTYDASRLQLVSATVMVPPWLPRPPAGFDPRKGQITPNGFKVKLGFRKHVLANNWDADNIPLQAEVGISPVEESNPALGAGTQQIFNSTTLEWTPTRGVFVAWTGPELLKVRADKAALQAEVAQLEAKLIANQEVSASA